jgi:type IV pilus assembly protein PilC
MPTFKYKGISKDKRKVQGLVEAKDEFEALTIIKETCNIVTQITPTVGVEKHKQRFQLRAVKEKALALICSQFSILLRSGVPMIRTVELIAEQTNDKTLKKILFQTAQDVAAGITLAHSLEKQGGGLPLAFIEMVRAGEESGTLDISFQKMYNYYDKVAKVKAKVISALTYPAFLIVAAIAVVAVILLVAVPMFNSIFASLGAKLPLPTRILIGTSSFFTQYGVLILIAVIALVIGLRIYAHTENGRLKFAKLILKLPLLGKIVKMHGASQFANTMSTLLATGLPMVRTINTTARVIENYAMSRAIANTLPLIEEGKSLGEALKSNPYFPTLLLEMTAVGEETGALESTMDVIGAYYDNEVEISTAKLLTMLEPMITVVMAVVVLVILLSIYLPMFSMYAMM